MPKNKPRLISSFILVGLLFVVLFTITTVFYFKYVFKHGVSYEKSTELDSHTSRLIQGGRSITISPNGGLPCSTVKIKLAGIYVNEKYPGQGSISFRDATGTYGDIKNSSIDLAKLNNGSIELDITLPEKGFTSAYPGDQSLSKTVDLVTGVGFITFHGYQNEDGLEIPFDFKNPGYGWCDNDSLNF